MQEQLEEAQSQLELTKRELKKRKESEGLLQAELEDVKEELSKHSSFTMGIWSMVWLAGTFLGWLYDIS